MNLCTRHGTWSAEQASTNPFLLRVLFPELTQGTQVPAQMIKTIYILVQSLWKAVW